MQNMEYIFKLFIIQTISKLIGDALVVAPLTNAVNLHLKLTGQKGGNKAANNVYSYVFVYQVSFSCVLFF